MSVDGQSLRLDLCDLLSRCFWYDCTIMNNTTNYSVNYAFKSGAMEGLLKTLTYRWSIPGVIITDRKAFEQFIADEITSVNKDAIEFSKNNPN